MSKSFYTHKHNAGQIFGSHGPLTEIDDMYCVGTERTLDPTPEQELAAGWFMGPNLSNVNADMVLRALELDPDEVDYDPADVLGRIILSRAINVVNDRGIAPLAYGNVIDCGVPDGYFADRFEEIAAVCEQAIEWRSRLTVC